jgi:hypothetical protein
MTRTTRYLLAIIFIIAGCLTLAILGQKKQASADIRTKPTDKVFVDLESDNWGERVAPAEKELESRQTLVIPDAIKLLDKDVKVKLKNTWDLIYPGADQFYGHGWVLDYDVDWVSVRAGWLLEELTFQDFGFQEGVIDHDAILAAVIAGKSESFVSDLKARLKGQDAKKQSRILAAQRAKDWFQREGANWKRFDAVVGGLKGSNTSLQTRILQWLRNRETKCDGLTIASFNELILPEVKRLARSSDVNLKEEAEYLIEDNSNGKWWYRNKLKRDFPETYSTMELK